MVTLTTLPTVRQNAAASQCCV